MSKMNQHWFDGKRAVYTWAGEQDENGCIPSMVIEHESGHRPMSGDETQLPWYWGKTGEECQQICNEKNEEMGFTKKEVMEIIATTMRYSSPIDYLQNLKGK